MIPAPDTGWGTVGPRPERWAHGPWAIVLCRDELADISFQGRPVVRSIRAVVRDRDWRTVAPVVESTSEAEGSLRVQLRFAGLGADLRGELLVSVLAGVLRVDLTLHNHAAFERNRIGLVVLHAAALAGADLTIDHVDGTRSASVFPVDIAPHQPAVDIRALAWTADGVRARLAFEGDVFEMEDQRNWTDASFKTYSTPLREPFPVRVEEGDEIRQRVELTCDPQGEGRDPRDPAVPAVVDLVLRGDRLPTFGLGATTEAGPLPRADGTALLVELEADRPTWRDALARAAEEAGSGGLDVRIVTDRATAVHEVVDELAQAARRGTAILRAGVFSPSTHLTEQLTWTALRDRAAEAGLAAALLGGTRAHFTELNRGHLHLPVDLPALTFSSTPQMHAVESRQLVESIDMQRLTAQSALRIAEGRPVHIGPITLRPRFNAVATAVPGTTGTGAGAALDPVATDSRQSSAALSAWTIASAAAFALPGVESVSYFEAAGPRGIRSLDGTDFPVRGAVAQLLALSGADAVIASALPRDVYVIAGTSEGGVTALIANLRATAVTLTLTLRFAGEEQHVAIPPLGHRRCHWGSGGCPSAAS